MLLHPSPLTRAVSQLVATVIALPFAAGLVVIVAMSGGGQGFAANYAAVLTRTPFLRSTLNSAVIALGVIALVWVTTVLAAYALGTMGFAGKEVVFNVVLVGLGLPTIALAVPLFLAVQRLQLFDNPVAVIVPLATTVVPFTVLLARNYLAGIPGELLEAARLDGCSSFGTLVRVVLPLARPITAVIVVWSFLQGWNEFFLPLLFFQDPALSTVTTIPLYFTSTYGSDQPKIFAALVLICLPVVLAYLCLQRFFERGLSAGALK